jgi:hypothetical protein
MSFLMPENYLSALEDEFFSLQKHFSAPTEGF